MSENRTQSSPASTVKVGAVRSPFYRDTYANTYRFRLSPSDFAIIFGNNTEPPGGGSILIQDDIGITMSYMNLKVLSLHLTEIVQEIEKERGEIRVPKTFLPNEQQIYNLLRSVRDNPLTV